MRYTNVTLSYEAHRRTVTATLNCEGGTACLDVSSLFKLYGEQFYPPERAIAVLCMNAEEGEPSLDFQDSGDFVVSLRLIDVAPPSTWRSIGTSLYFPMHYGMAPKIAVDFLLTEDCLKRSKGEFERYEAAFDRIVATFKAKLANG